MRLLWKITIASIILIIVIVIIILAVFRRMIFGGHIQQPFRNVWEDTNRYGKKYKDIILQMIVDMNKIFEKHNIHYFFMFGNLIGVARHGGLIPWDDDVDIVVSKSAYDMLMKLKPEFEKVGIGIEKMNMVAVEVIKLYALSEKSIMPLVWKFSWPFIDVFYYIDKGDTIDISSTESINMYNFKKEDIFPLKTFNLYDVPVSIPNNPKNILDKEYPGWDKKAYSSPFRHIDHTTINNQKKIPISQIQNIDEKIFTSVWIISTNKEKREKVQNKLFSIGISSRVWTGVSPESQAFLDVYEEINNSNVSKEELASLLSHYSLWKHLQEQGYPYAIIFENDITFSPNITKELLLTELNDSAGFVLLFLGHSKEKLVKRPSTYLGHANGRHAYAVSQTGISQLCELGNKVISNINDMTNNICKTELCFLSHTDTEKGTNKGGGIFFKQRSIGSA